MTEKKAEIIIKIDEEVLVPSAAAIFEAYCSECRRLVEMTSTSVAAAATGRTQRQIFRLLEAREIHFVETDRVLICLESLKKVSNR